VEVVVEGEALEEEVVVLGRGIPTRRVEEVVVMILIWEEGAVMMILVAMVVEVEVTVMEIVRHTIIPYPHQIRH